jgi:hypothetical protein
LRNDKHAKGVLEEKPSDEEMFAQFKQEVKKEISTVR